MSIVFKGPQIVWRERRSWGPDVEQVMLLPVFVAVESKPDAVTAFREIGQIIKYSESMVYDAVLIRLQRMGSVQDLERLKSLAAERGIGIVIGGSEYGPLTGSERILVKARVSIRENRAEMLSGILSSGKKIFVEVGSAEELLRELFGFRALLA